MILNEKKLAELPIEVIEYARNHDNTLEVVVRNAKKQFMKIAKIAIDDISSEKKNPEKDIFEQLFQDFFDANSLNHVIPNAIRNVIKKPEFTPDQIQKLVLQQILKNSNKADNLQPVQIILESLNLVATIASTVIICDKLNHLDQKLDKIAGQIDEVKRIQFETYIRKPCKEIILEYKELSSTVESGSSVEKKALVDTIKTCYHCIDSALSLRHEFSFDSVLPIIYTLLPTYSSLIVLYYQQFYYQDKKRLHPLHKDWLGIFDKLCEDSLLEEIRDDMILNQHQHDAKATEMINLHVLLAQGLKSEIELTLEDLQKCGSQEDYQNAMALATQLAMQQMDEAKTELSVSIGETEASRIVDEAKAQALRV